MNCHPSFFSIFAADKKEALGGGLRVQCGVEAGAKVFGWDHVIRCVLVCVVMVYCSIATRQHFTKLQYVALIARLGFAVHKFHTKLNEKYI